MGGVVIDARVAPLQPSIACMVLWVEDAVNAADASVFHCAKYCKYLACPPYSESVLMNAGEDPEVITYTATSFRVPLAQGEKAVVVILIVIVLLGVVAELDKLVVLESAVVELVGKLLLEFAVWDEVLLPVEEVALELPPPLEMPISGLELRPELDDEELSTALESLLSTLGTVVGFSHALSAMINPAVTNRPMLLNVDLRCMISPWIGFNVM